MRVVRKAAISSGSMVRISEIAKTASGTTPARGQKDYWEPANYPWVKTGEITFTPITRTEEFVSAKAVAECSLPILPPGSVLIAMYGQGKTRGQSAVLEIEATTNQACFAILPNDTFEPEYLQLWLRHSYQALRNMSDARGGNQSNLNGEILNSLEVPWVVNKLQQKIACTLKAQLAAVEEAHIATQEQVKELKNLRNRTLDALFENLLDTRPIGDAAKVQSGFAFKSQDFHTSGVRLLRNANVSPGRIDWSDVVFLPEKKCSKTDGYVMQEGDVVISLDRPIISSGIKVAQVTVADLPALLVQRVGRFLLNETMLDADYLYAFLQTNHFIDAISGHEQSLGVPHISPGQVEAVEIPMPPIEEQRRISAVAKEILNTTAEAQRAADAMLADISVLPSRLLAQAFDMHHEEST